MEYLDAGINKEVVQKISKVKSEPDWMLEYRLKSLEAFLEKGLPSWGPDLTSIDFDKIIYFASQGDTANDWNDVPNEIKTQFEELGVPEHEREALAGISTQYESEVVYHRLKKKFENTGIVFDTIENGLAKYPDLFKKYFGTLVRFDENKFTALNGAAWSGGSYVYVPKGVKLSLPIETYFRINADQMGQFERTLIIADEGSEIHYIEGCTAPQFIKSSLHSAVVEIFALKGAKVKYTTLQNWSKNVYNLVTKRAMAEEGSTVEWLDVNIGSKVTMKYPTVILNGERAFGSVNSIALSGSGQNIDSGSKMIHLKPNTRSLIKSTTISQNNGISTFRGLTHVDENAENSRAYVNCDNVQLSKRSVSKAYPILRNRNKTSMIEHEATASNISQNKLDYFLSRGIDEDKAREMILSGYFADFMEQLPLEYTIELERIIQLFNNNREDN